jgi:hypothetical protein
MVLQRGIVAFNNVCGRTKGLLQKSEEYEQYIEDSRTVAQESSRS